MTLIVISSGDSGDSGDSGENGENGESGDSGDSNVGHGGYRFSFKANPTKGGLGFGNLVALWRDGISPFPVFPTIGSGQVALSRAWQSSKTLLCTFDCSKSLVSLTVWEP